LVFIQQGKGICSTSPPLSAGTTKN
jgi:hypothetical protein